MVRCGACRGAEFGSFFRAREASVSGRYLAEPVAPTKPATIELEYCKTCGLVRQVPGRIIQLDYDGIERGTAQQLPTYASEIIASLSKLGIGPDDFVLEVGANEGTFLRELR